MHHSEIAGLMTALAPIVGDFVSKAVAPLRAENERLAGCLQDIEKRFLDIPSREENSVLILRLVEETVTKLPPAPTGKDGTDADPTLIAELVDKAVAALEPAKDGAPGPAGDSITTEQLAPIVAELVTNAVASEIEKVAPTIPAGAPGEKGDQGEAGKSVTVDDLAPIVAKAVADELEKVAANIPTGKDGAPGRDGRDGLPGLQGEKGIDGRDGVDGKDGFGIDDFEFKSENEGRTLVLSLKQADRDPIVQEVQTSIVLDRGVWREQEYAKGDGVTWGGSFFIAQRDTTSNEKPGEAKEAFRLSIKRGRDGKDGKDGKQGERGPEGKAGRDMTQRAF